MENELIRKAISELENPTFGTTVQYLEVLKVETDNGEPKVERIDLETHQEVNIVYIPIEDEPFFLTLHFAKETNELLGTGTENGNQVYLTATSEKLTFKELSGLTKLSGLSGWSMNDDRKIAKGRYTFSRISFEPIKSRAYDLEAKLKLLLTELEKDVDGIKKLTEMSYARILVHHQQYIDGNKGIHFDIETINRLSRLNLGIEIDQYVYGNPLKYER